MDVKLFKLNSMFIAVSDPSISCPLGSQLLLGFARHPAAPQEHTKQNNYAPASHLLNHAKTVGWLKERNEGKPVSGLRLVTLHESGRTPTRSSERIKPIRKMEAEPVRQLPPFAFTVATAGRIIFCHELWLGALGSSTLQLQHCDLRRLVRTTRCGLHAIPQGLVTSILATGWKRSPGEIAVEARPPRHLPLHRLRRVRSTG